MREKDKCAFAICEICITISEATLSLSALSQLIVDLRRGAAASRLEVRTLQQYMEKQRPGSVFHLPITMSNQLELKSNRNRTPYAMQRLGTQRVLLNIFDWYRLYNTTNDDQGWNMERWWYKPIHVCRTWRQLILTSPTAWTYISLARMVSPRVSLSESKPSSYIRHPYLL
jgi:hypothetical protein